MQKTQIQFLGQEYPLESEMATHSSVLAWEIHGQRNLVGHSQWSLKRVRHNLATKHQQQFSSVWSLSHEQLCDPMDCRPPCLKLTQTHVHRVGDAIQTSHPLLPLPSVFPSIRVFSNESVLHIRWPKYWSFSFSVSPSNEYLRLISFMIYWFDLLAVQGTLESLLQHHSLKASILWCSAFLMIQLSHPYMTIGKTRTLTRWAFVGKVMSLAF